MTRSTAGLRYVATLSAAALAAYAIARFVKNTRPWTGGQKEEAKLDRTLEATFPASDPPPF
jgi:hypothetical protein